MASGLLLLGSEPCRYRSGGEPPGTGTAAPLYAVVSVRRVLFVKRDDRRRVGRHHDDHQNGALRPAVPIYEERRYRLIRLPFGALLRPSSG